MVNSDISIIILLVYYSIRYSSVDFICGRLACAAHSDFGLVLLAVMNERAAGK